MSKKVPQHIVQIAILLSTMVNVANLAINYDSHFHKLQLHEYPQNLDVSSSRSDSL